MSIINFSINGYEGEQHAHLRSTFPTTKTEIYGVSGPSYDGNTRCIPGVDQDVYEIDSVVRVTTVAESIRHKEEEFWDSLQTNSTITFTVTLITGLILGAAAVALGVLVAPLIPIAVAIGAIALPILAYSFFMLYRRSQAEDQIGLWKEERVGDLVHQRQQAGKLGFEYVTQNHLQDVVVTKSEYADLWFDKASRYEREFEQAIDKTGQVKDFMRVALFDEKTLHSVFGTQLMPNVLKAKNSFKALQDQYNRITSANEEAGKLIYKEKSKLRRENERERDRKLEPIESLYQMHRSRLVTLSVPATPIVAPRHERLVGGRQVPGSRSSRMQVSVPARQVMAAAHHAIDYTFQLQQLDLIYGALKEPIHASYARNARQIDDWANGRLSELAASTDSQIARFHPAIENVLAEYHGLGENPYSAEVNPFIPSQPVASAPPIQYDEVMPDPSANFDPEIWALFLQQSPS